MPDVNSQALPPAVTFRPAQEVDTDSIVELLNRVYGNWGTVQHYRWKTQQTPTPFKLLPWLAVCDGKLVGHYGMLPYQAVLEGELIRAAQSVDAAVLPEYRRRGILASLEAAMLEQAAQAGVAMIYAFPGLFSLRMHDRVGYSPFTFVPEATCLLEPIPVWRAAVRHLPNDLRALWAVWKASRSRPDSAAAVSNLARLRQELLFVLSWAARAGRQAFPDSINGYTEITEAGSFTKDFDDLWQEVGPQVPIGLCKDAAYLRWRYASQPGASYRTLEARQNGRMVGFLVLRLSQGLQSEVCELVVAPPTHEAAFDLLAAARKMAVLKGKRVLNAWCAPHDPLQPAYSSAGFVFQSRLHSLARSRPWLSRWFYQAILYVKHLPPQQQAQIQAGARIWPLVKGDSDLV
jgi:GNAT superfamily N-acetyltransferase/ribosomal protein S18 acetylase RimI-like enzyme